MNQQATTRPVLLSILCSLLLTVCGCQSHAEQSTTDGILMTALNCSHLNESLNFRFKKLESELTRTTNLVKKEPPQCYDDWSCPPWFKCIKNHCKCSDNNIKNSIIRCNDTLQTSAVMDCFCVTFDEKRNTTVAGACFYNCGSYRKKSVDTVYHPLPPNLSTLNSVMCGHLNRDGPLCGSCKNESYHPLAYSYNLSCIECENSRKNWWIYIFVAFIPLTVFYFFVLFFKINATSSYLHGYLIYSQSISIPALVRNLLVSVDTMPVTLAVVKVLVSFYGILNLDFFRAVTPDICLNISTLQNLALDYIIAVYPLFLIIISYIMIELHDRNFRIVVFIWRPFRFIFTLFRRNWDSRTSVIDAYATFFLLSSTKFLSISCDLLIAVDLHELDSNESTVVLYYDGSINYLQKRHLPYAIMAIVVLSVFVLLPTTVMFLYPFRWFQKFLNCFPIRWHILHTFADSFQGCYKDGTEPGTRDCRWFAGIFVLFRVILFSIYALTLTTAYFDAAIIACIVMVMLLLAIQPFKQSVSHYTAINAIFILFIVLFYVSIAGSDVSSIKSRKHYKPFIGIAAVVSVLPLLFMICIVGHWLFTRRKWGKKLVQRFHAWRQGYDWSTFEDELESSLPDRIVNPQMYHEGNLTSFSNASVHTNSKSVCSTTY